MASNRPPRKRVSDAELVKALLETTSVAEAAQRVGLQPRSVQRRLLSPRLQVRLEDARRESAFDVPKAVEDPKPPPPVELLWKDRRNRSAERIPEIEAIFVPRPLKTSEERRRARFSALVQFAVRLIWATFHLLLLLAALLLLLLLVLSIRYVAPP